MWTLNSYLSAILTRTYSSARGLLLTGRTQNSASLADRRACEIVFIMQYRYTGWLSCEKLRRSIQVYLLLPNYGLYSQVACGCDVDKLTLFQDILGESHDISQRIRQEGQLPVLTSQSLLWSGLSILLSACGYKDERPFSWSPRRMYEFTNSLAIQKVDHNLFSKL